MRRDERLAVTRSDSAIFDAAKLAFVSACHCQGRRICTGLVTLWLMTILRLPAAEVKEVYGFPTIPTPVSGLVLAGDGALYGVTYGGGAYGYGSVFRIDTNGVMSTVASFTFTNGANPVGSLALGKDGALYGVTQKGGTNVYYGTVFQVTTNGALRSLTCFDKPYVPPMVAQAALVQGLDGAFYGVHGQRSELFRVTETGQMMTWGYVPVALGGLGTPVQGDDGAWYGTAQCAMGVTCRAGIYRVGTDRVSTAMPFPGQFDRAPSGSLAKGPDGALYGTLQYGGDWGWGSVFRATTNGEFSTLYSFSPEYLPDWDEWYWPDGRWPCAGLTIGLDGSFYGTTSAGGTNEGGTVFRITTNGVLATLASFRYEEGDCETRMAEGIDGNLYGVTARGGSGDVGMVFRAAPSGSLTGLVSFGYSAEGTTPKAGMVLGLDGSFYGTTCYGGGRQNSGTLFRFTTNGTMTTLASFDRAPDGIGTNPACRLLDVGNGSFYGTSSRGVFRFSAGGGLVAVASFGVNDGHNPRAGLIRGSDGALYGTTTSGESNLFASGTLFRLTTAGELTNLASFSYAIGFPIGELALGDDGSFYGVTSSDEAVFSVKPDGTYNRIAYVEYLGGRKRPSGGLVRGLDGAFYGLAQGWSDLDSDVLFRVSTNRVLEVLFEFRREGAAGKAPVGKLLCHTNGTFYGTTSSGGLYGCGTLFKYRTNGVLVALASFGHTTGVSPNGDLVFGPDGALYGTASEGGSRGGGSLFRVDISYNEGMVSLTFPCGLGGYGLCTFVGNPGETYPVLRATNVSGPWSVYCYPNTDGDGTGHCFEVYPRDQAVPQVFYRLGQVCNP